MLLTPLDVPGSRESRAARQTINGNQLFLREPTNILRVLTLQLAPIALTIAHYSYLVGVVGAFDEPIRPF